MRYLRCIAELIWPLLEPKTNDEKASNKRASDDVKNPVFDDESLDIRLQLAFRYFDSEEERAKTVESKSTIFVGCIGFVIAIIFSAATGLLLNDKAERSSSFYCSTIIWCIIMVYFIRAIWFSLNVVKKEAYELVGKEEFLGEESINKRELILKLADYTEHNSEVNNKKVDNMQMAQEYFKRGFVITAIYAIIEVVYELIICKSGSSLDNIALKVMAGVVGIAFLLAISNYYFNKHPVKIKNDS